MIEAFCFHRGIGMARDHRVVPLFPFFGWMLGAIFADPLENGRVIELVRHLFEDVGIKFQEGEQMLVEANGFVVIAIKQSLAM
jgi:hypothetical protein